MAAGGRRAASREREDKKKSADTAENQNTVYSCAVHMVCVRWWGMSKGREREESRLGVRKPAVSPASLIPLEKIEKLSVHDTTSRTCTVIHPNRTEAAHPVSRRHARRVEAKPLRKWTCAVLARAGTKFPCFQGNVRTLMQRLMGCALVSLATVWGCRTSEDAK